MARLVSWDDNRYQNFNSSSNNEHIEKPSYTRLKRRSVVNHEINYTKTGCWSGICAVLKFLFCIKFWNFVCCWCCEPMDNNDDDDVNRNFAKIRYEMNERANTNTSPTNSNQTSNADINSDTGISIVVSNNNIYFNKNNNSNKSKYKWDWDDSLRSNSDRFLETLEYDPVDGNRSWRKGVKITKSRISTLIKEELQQETAGSSNQVNEPKCEPTVPPPVPTASPVLSKVLPTNDPWPSQSDEDIDRLVALHRNRNSLTSLGVRSDSMASVYSGAGEGRYGTVTVRGQVEFGMQYNYKQGALEINVVQCKDLAAVDAKRSRSDPYVKVYLLPDKSKGGKRKTKVKKHTLNPCFDETLKFQMSLSSLESRTLWLTIWHSDMFGRNDFLGEVTISLQGKVFDNPQPQWHQLQERSEPFDDLPTYKGDIIVGLKFIPPESATPYSGGSNTLRKFSTKSLSTNTRPSTKGALHVLVKEAKNLTPVKASGACDAFCKSYLLPDKNRSSKQKTPVIKKSCSPIWNYTFIYEDITLNELSDRALELTLWDHDRLSSNEFLGGVRFSLGTGKYNQKAVDWMDSSGKELSLWQSMINRPNFWVEGCLPLRSSLDITRINN